MFSADSTNADAPALPVVTTADDLHHRIRTWKQAGETVALVPTMGNLHNGHLELVREAGKVAQHTVVSIFVNPTQFGPGEDFASYPRTFDQDLARLADVDVDLVFAPDVDTLYPGGVESGTYVDVPALSAILEGEHRPQHFSGVATVVNKLFNQVQPDIALFGLKDYQQLLVIRRMVRDLGMPVDIRAVPTVRESDGLAMSSRNSYLSREQRATASGLYACLNSLVQAINDGAEINFAVVHASQHLEAQGFLVDYVVVRRQQDLAVPGPGDSDLIALAAVKIGATRLIDNIPFSTLNPPISP